MVKAAVLVAACLAMPLAAQDEGADAQLDALAEAYRTYQIEQSGRIVEAD